MNERKLSQSGYSDIITVCNSDDDDNSVQSDYCSSVEDEKTVVHEIDSFDSSLSQKKKEKLKTSFYSLLETINIIYIKYSLSIFLVNSGNTARDHLANERTYLAWIRTSLSLTTSGIAIIQIHNILDQNHQRIGKFLGLMFVMASILFVCFGNIRYFHIQASLQQGSFPASRSIVSIAFFTVLFISISILMTIILEI